MPYFSIIIPAFNAEKYIEKCLASATSQSFKDIEIIVVDDGSDDTTPCLVRKAAKIDGRISLISHKANKGRHSARKTGVLEARGSYILFLDADDELAQNACELIHAHLLQRDVDLLHFGIEVPEVGTVSESTRTSLEQGSNSNIGYLENEEILRATFDPEKGYKVDWQIWQRAYKSSVIKEAFSRMADRRLNRAEDGYEFFVIAALSKTHDSRDNEKLYRYFHGRGITGESPISADEFGRFCEQFKECIIATRAFAAENENPTTLKCFSGYVDKNLELLSNDWYRRVREDEKPEALKHFKSTFGEDRTARELYRFARDESYALLQRKNFTNEELSHAQALYDSAERLLNELQDSTISKGCYTMRAKAHSHITDLEKNALLQAREKSPVKIFVSSHKNAVVPQSSIFIPVQVGSNNSEVSFPGYCKDNEGINISDKNPRFCELTTQYWAWKNIEADYYGFCHYRRYFNFSREIFEENPYGEIIDGSIDNEAAQKYGFDEKRILSEIEGFDVITTGFKDLRDFPGSFSTPLEQYKSAPMLHDEDLLRVCDILKNKHPEYEQDIATFLEGNHSCFCNMFIMKKEVFFDYCEWLFPILFEFDDTTDMALYSREALRTPGHLAERLLNIYLIHGKRTGASWKMKELQCVHFEKPEDKGYLEPAFDGSAIPVVFAADNNYSPQLAVALHSLVDNASCDTLLDLVVLTRNISQKNSNKIFECVAGNRPNVSLRFYDVSNYVKNHKLEANAHISTETYYRFLIQAILPDYDKVLYLDSDLVINANVQDLYNTDLGSNLLGAVLDADYLGNLNMKDGERIKYSKDTLHMDDPYTYFQAGVLLFNTRAMRALHTLKEWLDFASVPYLYNDQDILNMHCEGRVTYLDFEWNMMIDSGRLANVITYAPEPVLSAYLKSRTNPKIIHYAGGVKPWNEPNCDFASVFWSYARNTPFYEELIARLADKQIKSNEEEVYKYVINRHSRRSWKRKIADFFLPYGSKRREYFKKMGRRA